MQFFFDIAIVALEPLLQQATIWEIRRPFPFQLYRKELRGSSSELTFIFLLGTVRHSSRARPDPRSRLRREGVWVPGSLAKPCTHL